MTRQEWLNGVKSLFNIDGYKLPELDKEEQIRFVRDPVLYLFRASDEQADAILREVERRQKVKPYFTE